jgi:cardiolipin synthase
MQISTINPTESIRIVHSGSDYFSRLEQLILDSTTEIHIQMYIFENDETGKKVVESLKKAADRNVKIYLLLDGFGSSSLSNSFINDLRKNRINVRFFSPLFSANSFYISRRLHQKVVVSDSKTLLIGGINIANKYHGTELERAWLDYAVEIKSEMVEVLQDLCRATYFRKRTGNLKNLEANFGTNTKIKILRNDWLNRKNEVYKAYINSIFTAKKEIIIVGSYFLPGRKLTHALKKASNNNVKIKLILSGISDIPLLRKATYYFYSTFLESNIEMYEWNKSVLHGKAAVVDGNWTTIGSFNLNHLSSYGSIEMNVGIHSVEFSQEYRAHLTGIIEQCIVITADTLKVKQHFISKYTNQFSYWIIRVILLIITYLPYKRILKLH